MYTILKSTFLAGVLGLVLSSQAGAHAHLASATPPADATLAASPTELDLKFSEPINLKFSGVKVAGPDNAVIFTGAASLATGYDSTLLVPVLVTLPAGTYTVDWHVLSKDGHKTHGSYKFTVKP